MSEPIYTNVYQYGNNILVRELRNGKRVATKVPFKPTLFVKSQDKNSKYKDLEGNPLEPISFMDIKDAKAFTQRYEGTDGFELFGNTSYLYQYIAETYPGQLDHDISNLVIWTLDIETASEAGFPSVELANEEILLITLQDKQTKIIKTFGARPFDPSSISLVTNKDKFEYIECKNEKDLLAKFLQFWNKIQPDVITGWNSTFFDIPYLVNRITLLFGEEEAKLLSPWNKVFGRSVSMNGKDFQTFDLVGINHLDYLDLYKKFTYSAQESYKLDHISFIELGKRKIENPFETYKEFYTNNWQLFVEYNVIDVELVDQLEDKMKLIELITTMAYDAKCNFSDIYSAVKTWDCIIYNYLYEKNIIVPQRKGRPARHIEGAYVKDVVPGKYEWVASVDATSLYPSLMLQYNMSPETFVPLKQHDYTVDQLLEQDIKVEGNLAVAANGYGFKREKKGIFPELIEKIFNERVHYKKKMVQAQKEYEQTHDPLKKKDIAKFNNIQMARKIQLNSLYGAMANEWFRFYDDRIAEAVTISGQYVIRSVGNELNKYLSKATGENKDFAFYSDTDSCYITLNPLVKKFFSAQSKEKIIETLDTVCENKLIPLINSVCDEVAKKTNAFESRIRFKREVIADAGFWVAKKRYALNVYDAEGVKFETPKLKIMGLEIVRSSTPHSVKEYLRNAVKLILTSDESTLQEYIKKVEEEFMNMSPAMIAFPRGVNGLDKYESKSSIYMKGTPMHVRASLLYNHYIKKKGLTKKYELISEGSKIKFIYLITPNPIRENCIAFIGKIPKELDLERFVDYNTMFTKVFLDPITQMIEPIGWRQKKLSTLDLL